MGKNMDGGVVFTFSPKYSTTDVYDSWLEKKNSINFLLSPLLTMDNIVFNNSINCL